MAFSDITSRNAVLQAIAEFDNLGREAFLGKYGFGPARKYLLLYEGRRYDSKAVVGVAHGFQFPHLGPLPHEDFSGGLSMVVPLLRDLGFEVVGASDSGSGDGAA